MIETARIAALAGEIVRPAGLRCRYELRDGIFQWSFYRGTEFVRACNNIKKTLWLAEKLVDTGK